MGQDEFNQKLLDEIKTLSVNMATLTANYESISDCLKGLPDWQRAIDESSTRHSEKIQAIKTDVERLQRSNLTWLNRGWNAINSVALMIISWYFFGNR